MNGKNNIAIGFLTMGFFMLYGFLLIYLRDFAPNAKEWAESYSIGKHFETRLAHVHGNLFAFLNILIGYLLIQDRKSTRLNSSHVKISYAVFCLKKQIRCTSCASLALV